MTAPDLYRIPVSMLDEPVEPLLEWAGRALAQAGYRVLDAPPPAVRRRPWSTVIELATDRGPVWVKANARDFAPEAGLLALLARWAPDQVLPPIATDGASGRFIAPPGGRILRTEGSATTDDWVSLLTGYAELQRAAAPHVAELGSLGLPDLTPPTLAGWFSAVLDRVFAEPNVLAHFADPPALAALVPVTAALAADLGADGIGPTVEHNDLHTGNVFVGPPGAGGLRIFDWGDAVIGHPFLCLGPALRVAAEQAPRDGSGGTVGRVDLDRLRDAYLRCRLPAEATHIPTELRRSAALAETLSDVTMAASWLRIDVAATPERAAAFAGVIARYAANTGRLFSQPTAATPT